MLQGDSGEGARLDGAGGWGDRRDFVQPAFEALLSIVDSVFAIDVAAVSRAREIVLAYPRASARDAVHVAVMEREGVERILTFDVGFDQFPGISRVS